MAPKEEFMFQNVAYRPSVYKTGPYTNLFNVGTANYSYMSLEYGRLREDPDFRVEEISYEQDIIIFNRTKLKINIEGCVNTLSEECKSFYDKYGKFLRNFFL